MTVGPRVGVAMLLMATAAYCSLGVMVSCGAVRQGAAVDLHRAQLLACVDQAQSKAEARACFDRVDMRWGVLDGGPMLDAGALDGGNQ